MLLCSRALPYARCLSEVTLHSLPFLAVLLLSHTLWKRIQKEGKTKYNQGSFCLSLVRDLFMPCIVCCRFVSYLFILARCQNYFNAGGSFIPSLLTSFLVFFAQMSLFFSTPSTSVLSSVYISSVSLSLLSRLSRFLFLFRIQRTTRCNCALTPFHVALLSVLSLATSILLVFSLLSFPL